MSRLIDADALKANMFDYAPPEMTWSKDDIEHKIDEMPIVDSISVQWLCDYSGNHYDATGREVTVLEAMRQWKKENGDG